MYEKPEDVPLRTLFEAGVPMALGADDPLLFGSRLAAQYEIARQHHGFTDAELAELARQSVRGSAAPEDVQGQAAGGGGRLAGRLSRLSWRFRQQGACQAGGELVHRRP